MNGEPVFQTEVEDAEKKKAEKERIKKEKAERKKADRERAKKDKADKKRAKKEEAKKEKAEKVEAYKKTIDYRMSKIDSKLGWVTFGFLMLLLVLVFFWSAWCACDLAGVRLGDVIKKYVFGIQEPANPPNPPKDTKPTNPPKGADGSDGKKDEDNDKDSAQKDKANDSNKAVLDFVAVLFTVLALALAIIDIYVLRKVERSEDRIKESQDEMDEKYNKLYEHAKALSQEAVEAILVCSEVAIAHLPTITESQQIPAHFRETLRRINNSYDNFQKKRKGLVGDVLAMSNNHTKVKIAQALYFFARDDGDGKSVQECISKLEDLLNQPIISVGDDGADDRSLIRYRLGIAYRQQLDYDNSIKSFRQLIDIPTYRARGFIGLANTYYARARNFTTVRQDALTDLAYSYYYAPVPLHPDVLTDLAYSYYYIWKGLPIDPASIMVLSIYIKFLDFVKRNYQGSSDAIHNKMQEWAGQPEYSVIPLLSDELNNIAKYAKIFNKNVLPKFSYMTDDCILANWHECMGGSYSYIWANSAAAEQTDDLLCNIISEYTNSLTSLRSLQRETIYSEELDREIPQDEFGKEIESRIKPFLDVFMEKITQMAHAGKQPWEAEEIKKLKKGIKQFVESGMFNRGDFIRLVADYQRIRQ